jgi:predicted PurR-regulated permease PerM
VLLTTPVRLFVRRGIARPVAVLLSAGLILAAIIAIVLLVLPDLLVQFRLLVTTYIPQATQRLEEQLRPVNLRQTFAFLKDYSDQEILALTNDITRQLSASLSGLSSQLFPFFSGLIPFFSGLLSTIISILVVLFLAFYFVADPDTHTRGIIRLVPIRIRPRAMEILRSLDRSLRNFLEAQVLLMLLTGVSTAIVLALMGVPLAGALGTITGLFSFVPNFGPLVSLVPIVAVALINTPQQLGLIIVVYYVLQFIQSQLITPLLMGQEVNLPPAVILLSQIVAGIFFGFLGLLLSVPLAAIGVTLVREIYIKDLLGDRETDDRGRPTRTVPDPEPARVT